MKLHADATRELTRYQPQEPAQIALREEYLAYLGGHPDATTRSCAPAHLTASAIVVDPGGSQVVLVHHRKVGLWLQPGGHCEAHDATLAGAALREATEETGLTDLRPLPGILRLDRHRAPCASDWPGPGPMEHHLDVMFAVLAPSDAAARVSEESLAVRWFAVDALPSETDDAVRALVAAAVARVRG
ncbi:MAG: NUDIX hydrolase [Sporichthyaceae bacterium]